MGRLILWDIDGTLVSTGGVGADAFSRAMETVLGYRPAQKPSMHGKTDLQIVRDYFALLDLDGADRHAPAVLARLETELAAAEEEIRTKGHPLPGVETLLRELHAMGDTTQTVLTGNLAANARLKVATFGLDRWLDLEIGAFGSDNAHRPDLLPIALERAARRCGKAFDPVDVWIIGDSPNDLACAQSGGVRCLLVATGVVNYAELSDLGADALVPDLSDTNGVLALLGLAPQGRVD